MLLSALALFTFTAADPQVPAPLPVPTAVQDSEKQDGPKKDAEGEKKPDRGDRKELPSAKDDATPALKEITAFIRKSKIDTTAKRWKTRLPEPPKLTFEEDVEYFWHMQTNKGDIKIKLMPEVAPMHVSSTIYLSRLGFYDDLTFHRVIPGFMAQGGCPLGSGSGSPGYSYDGEFDRKVRHDRPGLLSMANRGPETDGSQFFLTFVKTPHLDGKHTIFGEVVEGMETLSALERLGSSPSGRTKEKLELQRTTISVKKVEKKADEKKETDKEAEEGDEKKN